MFNRFLAEESGQGMVEYALIVALIGVLLITVLKNLKGAIDKVFTKATNELNGAGGTP